MHALLGRAEPEHLPERTAQTHGARAPAEGQYQPSTSISARLTQHHQPGAALRLGALEAAAGVPDQVADAGDQVVAEGDEQRGVQELERPAATAAAWRARWALRPARDRHQPVDEQQQPERQARRR